MSGRQDMDGALARHRIANLLCTCTDIAVRKDVEAGVALLGGARVRFPAGGFEEPGEVPGTWAARAHYTRWVFEPGPVLHTLGEYTVTVVDGEWTVSELTVSRTWTRS